MAELAANPETWPTHPLSMGYQYPDRVPQDAWRDYLTGTAGTIERARDCERLIASLDAADIEAVGGQLRTLKVPTLLVWGTADPMFAVKWAYHLRDLIPGAREVIEIDGSSGMIEARDLTKFYGRKAAVDQLSFTVEPGRVTEFLGPNGAGSPLLDCDTSYPRWTARPVPRPDEHDHLDGQRRASQKTYDADKTNIGI